MNLTRLVLAAGVILQATQPSPARAETARDWPDLVEVMSLLRSNLVSVSESELNRAAVQGLTDQLHPSVLWVTNTSTGTATERGPLVSKTGIYDDSAYLRPDRIEAGVAEELASGYGKIKAPATGLKGLVLDLRFVEGQDYREAAAFADRFLKTEQLLLDWQSGSARSAAKPTAWNMPLMVLVNRKTAGAAEALAALFQTMKIGLVIGSRTAGQAQVFKEFPLTADLHLRVAVANIKVGEDHALTRSGVTPDIVVSVPEDEELAFLADPFKGMIRTAGAPVGAGRGDTNRAVGRRVNEADLVRRQREGLDPDRDLVPGTTRDGESERVVVRDPALARALDLLKGIAVVQRAREL